MAQLAKNLPAMQEAKWKWKSLSRVQLCNPMDCLWNSPGQNTRVGSLSLLQGIFPTQRSNPGLPHCRRILYQLSNQGSNARDLGLIPRSGRSPDQGMATHSSGNGEWSLVKSLRLLIFWGLPWCLSGQESACNVGDLGLLSFPWVRKIPWRRT